MTDLASAVVQVVTVGTDWPAIVAAISGGVVGVAGIIFAWRQLGRTIRAEDARAKLAEKRRVYANCIATFTTYGTAIYDVRRGTELPPEQLAGLKEASRRARLAATHSALEVYLIGSIEVARMADRMLLDLYHAGRDPQSHDASGDLLMKLRSAMRGDLGEGAPPIEQTPEVPIIRQADPESARTAGAGAGT